MRSGLLHRTRLPALLLLFLLGVGGTGAASAQEEGADPTPAPAESDPGEGDPSWDDLGFERSSSSGAAALAGPWFLVPRLRAPPGSPFRDALGGGRYAYVLDDQGILYHSRDYGKTFAGRDLRGGSAGLRRQKLPPFTIPSTMWGLRMAGSYNFVGSKVYLILSGRDILRWNISDAFSFPYGTTGQPYLELTPDSPAFQGGLWIRNLVRPGNWDFFNEPPASSNLSFFPAGRLLRQTGSEAERSTVLSVDVNQPERVAVASADGVYVSNDGGLMYDPLRSSPPFPCCSNIIFAGSSIVGISMGTMIVRSKGVGDPLLPGAVVPGMQWLVRDKGDSDHILVVMGQELWESFDQGRTIDRVFMAPASKINHVSVHPGSGQLWVSTNNGLYVRQPGSKRFEPRNLGGPGHVVEVNPLHPQEILVSQHRTLLRSLDGGQTFEQFLELDDYAVAFLDPVPGRSWLIVTRRGLFEMSREPPKDTDPARLALARYVLKQQPSASAAILAAQKRYVPRVPTAAWWDQLLPRVHVMAGALYGPQQALLNAVFLGGTSVRDGRFAPDTIGNQVNPGQNALLTRNIYPFEPFGVVLMSWDLPGLIGPPHDLRRTKAAAAFYKSVEKTVARQHSLRTRLIVERVVKPPADLSTRIDLELRIAESTALLNALCGGGFRTPDFETVIDQEVEDVPTKLGHRRALERGLLQP